MYQQWVVSKRQTVNLTYGKAYQLQELSDSSSRYTIINDRGQLTTSSINNFMTLEEARDMRLSVILEQD